MPKNIDVLAHLYKTRDVLYEMSSNLLLKTPELDLAFKATIELICVFSHPDNLLDTPITQVPWNTTLLSSLPSASVEEFLDNFHKQIAHIILGQLSLTTQIFEINYSIPAAASAAQSIDSLSTHWKIVQLLLMKPQATVEQVQNWLATDISATKTKKKKHHQAVIIDADTAPRSGEITKVALQNQFNLILGTTVSKPIPAPTTDRQFHHVTFEQLRHEHQELITSSKNFTISAEDLVDSNNPEYLAWIADYHALTNQTEQLLTQLDTRLQMVAQQNISIHTKSHTPSAAQKIFSTISKQIHLGKTPEADQSQIPYHQELAAEILSVNQQLNQKNIQRHVLAKNILQYKGKYFPTETDPTKLVNILAEDTQTLLNKLTPIITAFCSIKATPRDYKAMKDIYEPAIQWINQLEHALNSIPFTNKVVAAELVKQLRDQLQGVAILQLDFPYVLVNTPKPPQKLQAYQIGFEIIETSPLFSTNMIKKKKTLAIKLIITDHTGEISATATLTRQQLGFEIQESTTLEHIQSHQDTIFKRLAAQKDIPNPLSSIFTQLFRNLNEQDKSEQKSLGATRFDDTVGKLLSPFRQQDTPAQQQQREALRLQQEIGHIRQLTSKTPVLDVPIYQAASVMRHHFNTLHTHINTLHAEHKTHHAEMGNILEPALRKYRYLAANLTADYQSVADAAAQDAEQSIATQNSLIQKFHTTLQSLETAQQQQLACHNFLENNYRNIPTFKNPKDISELDKQHNSINKIDADQSRYHTEYQRLLKSIDPAAINQLYDQAIQLYQAQLTTYQKSLESRLKALHAALNFQCNHKNALSQINKSDIEKTIKQYQHVIALYPKQIDALTKRTKIPSNLLETQKKNLENQQDMDGTVKSIKQEIQTKMINPNTANIDHLFRAVSSDAANRLDAINPYKIDLINATTDCEDSNNEYQAQASAFDLKQPHEWSEWHVEFSKRTTDLQTEIGKHTQLNTHAKNIEDRIKSAEYQASRKVVKDIQEEIYRIFDHHMNDSRLRGLVLEAAKTALHNKIIAGRTTGLYLFSPSENIQLGYIDPRINKLLDLHKDFKALNDKFICKNYHFYALTAFKTDLHEAVRRNLQTDNMENFSDGVNSKFYQKLRRLLKPIVRLFHQPPKNGFFHNPIIFGATKTETWAVKTGNRLANDLQMPHRPVA